jgi:hypothetical protein
VIIAQITVDPATDLPFPASVFGFDLTTFAIGIPGSAWTCLFTSQAAAPDNTRNAVVSVDEASMMGIDALGFLPAPGVAFATTSIVTGAPAMSAGLVRVTVWRIPGP